MDKTTKTLADIRLRLADWFMGSRIPFHGSRIYVPPTVHRKVRRLCLVGTDYEKPEIDLVDRHIRPGMSVIEMGGSIGAVSSFIGKHLTENDTHIVVEALPGLAKLCERNARASNKTGNVQIVNKAVSYGEDTVVRFMTGHNEHVGRLAQPDEPALEVEATRLSALVEMLPDGDDFAVVCDIEGGEYDMIEQDRNVLRRAAVAIVEFHDHDAQGNEIDIDAYLAGLPDHGFDVIERIGPVAAIVPRESGADEKTNG